MKYMQAWTRVSTILLRRTLCSCAKYASKRCSMVCRMGSQLGLRVFSTYVLLAQCVSHAPGAVVHEVTEPRRVHDSEPQSDTLLLDICGEVVTLRAPSAGTREAHRRELSSL